MPELHALSGCLLLLALSCTGPAPDPHTEDVPTRGDVLMLADEDLRTIIEAERFAFESTYTDARIRIEYLPEAELLKAMMNDSVRVVFTTCLPGGEQEAYFKTRSLSADAVPILTDGIAVLRAKGGAGPPINVQDLKSSLMTGTGPTVLFDGPRTGVARTLVDSLFAGDASSMKGAGAVESTDSLVHRLRRDPSAIGLISFARISDLDDPACRSLREGLEVCALAHDGPAVEPNQSTLADGTYPLRRTAYALLVEGKTGLGTGFVSFVAGHKGQRIILKTGLPPMKVPARNVELVH